MPKEVFNALVLKYTDTKLAENLWCEIEKHYAAKSRPYHNLKHLENLLEELEQCREQIEDYDTVLFALFYHDIIYKATSKENEEKSAAIVLDRLKQINYPADKTERCYNHIIATKAHSFSADNDTNLFTDADLSILGYTWDKYSEYCQQVRKEYAIYPDFLYNPGRKKALQHFLEMDTLFKTDFFRDKYEIQARKNIVQEISGLV
jgi:predicted metal-dependent HD superfamily phosphohydrolase